MRAVTYQWPCQLFDMELIGYVILRDDVIIMISAHMMKPGTFEYQVSPSRGIPREFTLSVLGGVAQEPGPPFITAGPRSVARVRSRP